MPELQIITNPTNEELRRLKSLHRLTIPDIVEFLTSDTWGGPHASTVGGWLATSKNNRMPANSLELLIIRLDESGYSED